VKDITVPGTLLTVLVPMRLRRYSQTPRYENPADLWVLSGTIVIVLASGIVDVSRSLRMVCLVLEDGITGWVTTDVLEARCE
jgi:hypothetical protein